MIDQVEALLAKYERQIAMAPGVSEDVFRLAWVVSGLREWKRCIRDTDGGYPGDTDEIAQYFRMCGWDWYLNSYGRGTYVETFERPDGTVEFMEWCGIFHGATGSTVGAVLQHLGHVGTASLRYGVRYFIMPGTPRFISDKKWSEAGCKPFLSVNRLSVRPGDIVTLGSRHYGSHIAMVIDTGPDFVLTLEGNATGLLPNGAKREGVVIRKRMKADIKRAYRATREHVVGI